jgi:hypothetical protein
MKKKCSMCKVDFECFDSLYCWCYKMPKLSKDKINANGCVCKNCLMKKYKEGLIP